MYNNVLKKSFLWMALGLLVTFATGFYVSLNPNMLMKVFSAVGFWGLIIVELGLVFFLSARVTKMNPTTARIMFLLYSFVNGLTFSSIFIAYEISSIIFVFLIAAALFGLLAFFGYATDKDLTKLSTYLFVGLIAVIIASIIGIFVVSDAFILILSIISIVLFLGFTAYDVQKIKELSNYIDEDNLAIYGALQLYLDFINIFLDLLRIFGNNRD